MCKALDDDLVAKNFASYVSSTYMSLEKQGINVKLAFFSSKFTPALCLVFL
jgi:hypothetical protein